MARSNRATSAMLISGLPASLLRMVMRLHILFIALAAYRKPFTAMQVLSRLIAIKRTMLGSLDNLKWVKSGGRYFWNISSPGWPSEAFKQFLLLEMDRLIPLNKATPNRLQTLVYSITGKCPLKCEHCYEWNNLASDEHLSYEQLKQILFRFQEMGVCNVELSGGEPLCRFADLVSLLKDARPGTDFWILTSGFELDKDKAQELKRAGLTGVVVSLDHYDAEIHNRFRGNKESYTWVWKAVQNANEAGLAVALSLCVTKEFLSEDNLDRYMKLAADKGIKLVRVLEPRSVGHYLGQDIELSEDELSVLDSYFLKTSCDPAYRDYPILDYLAYYQRRLGCFGGDRYVYIDSKGEMHACPFCQSSAGYALAENIEEALQKLQARGCHKYAKADTKTASLMKQEQP
jgi:MoaA/NifB/PqqE/SkfB family radical SAM enzyme